MSIDAISRALKYANVPRCKVVYVLYPNPRIIIHVPQSHVGMMTGVIGIMRLDIEAKVTLLESNEVRDGEHVLIKMKSFNGYAVRNDGESLSAWRQRYRTCNRSTVIECASAFA